MDQSRKKTAYELTKSTLSRLRELYTRGGVKEVCRGIYDWMYYTAYRPLLVWLLQKKSLTVQNTTVHFSIESEESIYRAKGHNEIEVISNFVEDISSSDIVWDIGANQGSYTLFAAKIGANVHAFEPGEPARRVLKKNLDLNGLTSTVHAVALGDSSGEVLLTKEDRSGKRKVASEGKGDPVPVLPGNKTMAPDPDVIKIDVEGYEISVLKGLNGILNSVRVLYVELHEDVSRKRVQSILNERGLDTELLRVKEGQAKTLRAYRTND